VSWFGYSFPIFLVVAFTNIGLPPQTCDSNSLRGLQVQVVMKAG
jgi:hypothetical protein